MIASVPLPKKLPPMSAADVRESLGRAYDRQQGYLLIHEISVPGHSTRRADAIALQMYASRGIGIHGFEIKVERRDWQNELRDAGKADEVFSRCRTFSLVTPQQLIDPSTLPPGWGLLEVRHSDRKVLRTVEPAKREPEPLDLYSVALILRRAYDFMERPWNELRAKELQDRYQEGVEAGKAQAERRTGDVAAADLARLQARVEKFEQASGIDLSGEWSWNDRLGYSSVEELGQAVKFLLEARDQVATTQRIVREYAQRLVELASEKPAELPRVRSGR